MNQWEWFTPDPPENYSSDGYDSDDEDMSVYTQEDMIYLDTEDEGDSEEDSIVEVNHEGSWSNPIDLTEDGTDEEAVTDNEDELYLD